MANPNASSVEEAKPTTDTSGFAISDETTGIPLPVSRENSFSGGTTLDLDSPAQSVLTDNNANRSFVLPFSRIPIRTYVPISLRRSDFTDVAYIGNGSNSFVYTAKLGDDKTKIIIKMLKTQVHNRRVAEQEIVSEAGILARLNHPNIVRIHGAGEDPRKFIVVEYLGGGTLGQLLYPPKNNGSDIVGRLRDMYKKPSSVLPLSRILHIAREIARAVSYLHNDFNQYAMVVHRDLKPDNIGFTVEGQLKLFDFGLMACVKKRNTGTQAYEMTGNTGTLVHMAPEVALRKPYTEKVDIYSVGVILWQMTSGEIPFADMKRDDFMARVVNQGHRPRIRDDLPEVLVRLIQRCWDSNPAIRPSSEELLKIVDSLCGDGIGSEGSSGRAKSPHNRVSMAASPRAPRLFGRQNGRVADEALSLSLLSTMAVKSLQSANDKPAPPRRLAGGPPVSAIRPADGGP